MVYFKKAFWSETWLLTVRLFCIDLNIESRPPPIYGNKFRPHCGSIDRQCIRCTNTANVKHRGIVIRSIWSETDSQEIPGVQAKCHKFQSYESFIRKYRAYGPSARYSLWIVVWITGYRTYTWWSICAHRYVGHSTKICRFIID